MLRKCLTCILGLFVSFLPLSVLSGFPFSAAVQAEQEIQDEPDGLEVIFLDAGKADAFVLLARDSAVLIDTGRNSMGGEIVDYLLSRGVERIDAMIITHFDKDHVGGADAVLEALPVDAVYEPVYEEDSKQYRQYRDALDQIGLAPVALSENISFEIGGARYSIDVANREFYGEGETNDFSLVVGVQWGNTRFLFAGDAENDRLAELLDEGNLKSDVLKVPHHGGYESLSSAFFQAVCPQYAVITSDDENPEDETVMHILSTLGVEVYLTRLGDVTCRSDGESLTFSQNARQE